MSEEKKNAEAAEQDEAATKESEETQATASSEEAKAEAPETTKETEASATKDESPEDAAAEEDTAKARDEEADEQDEVEEVSDEEEADEDETDEEEDASSNGKAAHRVEIEQLLKAGTHFGHLTSRWNPKMKPFIFMERNGIHVVDLMQTQVLLDRAAEAAERFARRGRTILFVGTKKQARDTVRKHAEAANSPYVVERWLGGMLTNFQTMRLSIRRMEQLERMEDDGTFDQLKKKERLTKIREREKLERNLGGIRHMARLPGAIFIVDVKREHIAVNEAVKLNIPIIAMTDTNADPDPIDFPIPANDDALKSIDLITGVISQAAQTGQAQKQAEDQAKKQEKQKQKQKG